MLVLVGSPSSRSAYSPGLHGEQPGSRPVGPAPQLGMLEGTEVGFVGLLVGCEDGSLDGRENGCKDGCIEG